MLCFYLLHLIRKNGIHGGHISFGMVKNLCPLYNAAYLKERTSHNPRAQSLILCNDFGGTTAGQMEPLAVVRATEVGTASEKRRISVCAYSAPLGSMERACFSFPFFSCLILRYELQIKYCSLFLDILWRI